CLHFQDLSFFDEKLLPWVLNDFSVGDPFSGAAFPVLPYSSGQSNTDAQSTTISSLAVLEGLAVLGEILSASRRAGPTASAIRFSVPHHYTVGLRFALECVNQAHGTNY